MDFKNNSGVKLVLWVKAPPPLSDMILKSAWYLHIERHLLLNVSIT